VAGFCEHGNKPSGSIKKAAYFLTLYPEVKRQEHEADYSPLILLRLEFMELFLHSPTFLHSAVHNHMNIFCPLVEKTKQSADPPSK
jgi:hypothetical protein